MNSKTRRSSDTNVANEERRAIDYVNVRYASAAVGRRFLSNIGRERINPELSNQYNLSASTDAIDGLVSPPRRWSRRNRQPQKQLMTLVDSYSCSLDCLSENPEAEETREQEKKHYNKLKLNVNHLGNKHVRRGWSVLYADRINGELSIKQRTPSGTRKTRHNNTPSRFTQSADSRPTKHQLQVNKEGHVNQLHSVTGKPVSRASNCLWKKSNMTKSFSTGDMNQIGEEFGEPEDRPWLRRSCSNSDIQGGKADSARLNAVRRRYENVEPTDKGERLRVAIQPPQDSADHRGEVPSQRDEQSKHRHSVLRNSFTQSAEILFDAPSPVFDRTSPSPYLSPIRSPIKHETKGARLSPLARPADMKGAPLSPLLSPVHNNSCPVTCSCRGVEFIDTIVTIPCDSNGGEYLSEDHDFKIVIPKGAIKKKVTTELRIGVTLQGPFDTPNGSAVVSPIVWISAKPEIKLKRAIEIKLPHVLERNGTHKSESFLRASEKISAKTKISTKKFSFKEVSGTEAIVQQGYGILLTKQFGFYCIGTTKLSRREVRCCLVPVIPQQVPSNTWKIHYCVCYQLKSCLQLVAKQFGPDYESLPVRSFTFPSNSGALEISFERQLLEAGWVLALESNNKILVSEVDLPTVSGYARGSESISTYPPRFTIRVHGGEARLSSMATMMFTGCCEELRSEILLPLRFNSPLSTPTSSLFSPPHNSPGSSQEGNFMTTPLTPPTNTRLGWPCHVTHCTCEECSPDYDHLSSLEELSPKDDKMNGCNQRPSDEYLRDVSDRVTRQLQGDWSQLQTSLGIPDYIMLDVLKQRTISQQVYRLLREWRDSSKESSENDLVQCLVRADQRLTTVLTN